MACTNISYAIDQTKWFQGKPSKGRLSVFCAHSFHHTKYDSLLSNLHVHLSPLISTFNVKTFIKNRHIAQLGILGIKVMQKWPSSNAKKRGMQRILSECYILWNNKLGILVKGSSVSATLILLSGGILTPFFYQTPRLR